MSLFKKAAVLCLAVMLIQGPLGKQETSASLKKHKQQGKRILLLWQGPDGHPKTTHEYEAGIRLIGNWFQQNTNYQVILSEATDKWEEGPELLERVHTVVMFFNQASRWMQQDPERLKAFQHYARRGGGLVGIHWGIGSKRDEDIAAFLPLLGATHGGKDRKYAFLKTRFRPTNESHAIQQGLRPIEIEDEYYYNLKQFKSPSPIVPLMEARIENEWYMVAWAWERPQGGRSFGFSGLHYHGNWSNETYRRLVFQGILWTLEEEIPEGGINVSIKEEWLKLPDRPEK
jgi:hypothetical protein